MSEALRIPTQGVDIACVGGTMVDLVGVEPSAGLDGVETFRRSLGGAPANVSTMATRLGRQAAIVGRIGDDAFGRYIRAEMQRRKIRDTWLQIDPTLPTTVAFFAPRPPSSDFIVVRGADQELTLDEASRDLIRNSAALHVTTFVLSVEPARLAAVEAIELAHAAGKIVSLDPNFRAGVWPNAGAFMPLLRQLLPLATIIKPSLKDAEAIWGPGQSPGDYIERFHAHGARQVLLTLGREGVIASDGTALQRLPAMPIDVANTAGVGDAFTAGAITALIDGRDLLTAAQVGMLVANYRLRSPEYRDPLPRWAVLLAQAVAGAGPDPALQIHQATLPRRNTKQ